MMSFGSWFRSLDEFGEPVTLVYKKESKYKTIFGATLTVLARICILAYSFNKGLEWYWRSDPELKSYSKQLQLQDSIPEDIELGANKFELSLNWWAPNDEHGSFRLDPEYGQFFAY